MSERSEGGHVQENDAAGLNRRTLLQQSLLGGLLAGAAFDGVPHEAAAQSAGAAPAMLRRVVVGNNAEGKSYVVKDEMVKAGDVWHNSPQEPLGPGVAAALLPSTQPQFDLPAGGSRLLMATFPPTTKKPEQVERGSPKDGFHRTKTLDYVYALNNQVTVYLDVGEFVLHAGDLVIFQNAVHAWQNFTSEPTRVMGVMIGV